MENFDVVIRSDAGDFKSNMKEVYKYRDLVRSFINRNFASLYKQTILGPAWIVLSPLISSVIFTFVFGGLAGMSTDNVPQFLFYLAGNSMWLYFSSAFTGIANIFSANAYLYGKVYFPRLVLPLSQIGTSLINFLVQLGILILFYVCYIATGIDNFFSLSFLLLPVILLQLGLLALGTGMIIASLTTKYRDLALVIVYGVQLWMYISPIVYPVSSLSGLTYLLVLINPVTIPFELFRIGLYGEGTFVAWSYGVSWLLTIIFLAIGLKLFSKTERVFMDTI
ncbi:MAG: ABC transporter permease [Faecalibacterium sp.]